MPIVAPRLSGCRSWVMQLQTINWERIEATIADVAVIDATADGTPDGTFSAGVVERMRSKPGGGDTIVLCYLSIGAAEPWRAYWNGKWQHARPAWMEEEAGAWQGTHRVQYWDPRWQQIIFGGETSMLAAILAAGYDGVALDGIDSFAYFRAKGRERAPEEMIELVARFGTAAWASNPSFLIVPINGAELIGSQRYRSVISAVIQEDILFRTEAPADGASMLDNNEATIAEAMDDLAPALIERIPVLAIEYLCDDPADAARVPGAVQRLRRLGLVPYIAPRRLDRLAPTLA
jgi:cysteinyl-tRNA synthetase